MRHDLKECGKRIHQLRKERGLTQEQLAEKDNEALKKVLNRRKGRKVLAVMCHYKFEPEHGLAIVFDNNKLKDIEEDIVL